jgi:hypothetical protein
MSNSSSLQDHIGPNWPSPRSEKDDDLGEGSNALFFDRMTGLRTFVSPNFDGEQQSFVNIFIGCDRPGTRSFT